MTLYLCKILALGIEADREIHHSTVALLSFFSAAVSALAIHLADMLWEEECHRDQSLDRCCSAFLLTIC